MLTSADIYGAGHNVQKGFLYKAAIAKSRGVNTFNSIDRSVHTHKRRALAPCFTDHTLRSNAESVLPIIRSFFNILSGDGQSPWEGDMSQWSNYLVFDIMGKLSFGKDFGMLSGPENRGVSKLIDANTHITLIVRYNAITQRTFLLMRSPGRLKSLHSQFGSRHAAHAIHVVRLREIAGLCKSSG